jgi:acyl-CoA thioesterase II
MGDLAIDTTMDPTGDPDEHTYARVLSREWEIWGPMGGYLASCALRAVGAHSGRARPASFVGHFLGVADFEHPIVATCTMLRGTRRADSIRVSVSQVGRPIFEAMVWAVDTDIDGLTHHQPTMPTMPPWNTLPTIEELFAAKGLTNQGQYPFWNNFEQRTVRWTDDWDARKTGDIAPLWETWLKYLPTSHFDDPWIDACRLLILVDVGAWPAVGGHHAGNDYFAPSIDVTCEFNQVGGTGEWLFVSAESPAASSGLVTSRSQVFDDTGQLLALGTSQLLCKAIRN